MSRYGSPLPVQSVCSHCGDETNGEIRQYDITGDSVAISFCKHCEAAFFQLSDDEKEIISYETDTNGVVTNISLPYTISRDVQTGSKVLKPVDDFDPSEFDPEDKQMIGDAYKVTTQEVCVICEEPVSGDHQLLGKDVCTQCFRAAKNGKVAEYRKRIKKKFTNKDVTDYGDEQKENIRVSGNNVQNVSSDSVNTRDSESGEPDESESERPDDYAEWSIEQWQDAYVEDEITITALEIGIGHALEEQVDFGNLDTEKFDRSIEVAEELS